MCCDDETPAVVLHDEQVLRDAAAWVRGARRRDLLELIAEIARDYQADEVPEDGNRRARTVLWLATRGSAGTWHPGITPERFLAKRRAGP